MKVGVLATGNTAVRAAHSLAAHPGVDSVVVVGAARSKTFPVVKTARGIDILVGTGDRAPAAASRHGVPLLWDGEPGPEGVMISGASPAGVTLAIAASEEDPRLVALAHPDVTETGTRPIRFPRPIGRLEAADGTYGGRPIAVAKSKTEFASCYVVSTSRSLTIVDDAAFLGGVALAAGIALLDGEPKAVWDEPFAYLRTATEMGLVMGEAG